MSHREMEMKNKTPVKKTVKAKTKTAPAPAMLSPLEIVKSNLQAAIKSGKWISITLRVSDGRIFIDMTAVNFPRDDIDTALTMIGDDLNKLKMG